MRIAIVGAGAIGGWLGAWLADSGQQVSLLARGAQLAAIREKGLRVESAQRVVELRFAASQDPAELGEQDFVAITLKNTAMEAVAPTLAPLFGAQTAVMSAMNGVPWWFQNRRLASIDPHGVIQHAIEPRRIIGAVVHASCAVAGPGVIRHNSGRRIVLGEPGGAGSPRCMALAGALRAAGFDCEVTGAIEKEVWNKLLGNLALNPISALTCATTDRIIDDRGTHALCVAMISEALALAAALGIDMRVDPEQRIATSRKLGAVKSSMLQDMEAGKPIELDAIVGAVVELAELAGLEMPNVRAVHALLRLRTRLL